MDVCRHVKVRDQRPGTGSRKRTRRSSAAPARLSAQPRRTRERGDAGTSRSRSRGTSPASIASVEAVPAAGRLGGPPIPRCPGRASRAPRASTSSSRAGRRVIHLHAVSRSEHAAASEQSPAAAPTRHGPGRRSARAPACRARGRIVPIRAALLHDADHVCARRRHDIEPHVLGRHVCEEGVVRLGATARRRDPDTRACRPQPLSLFSEPLRERRCAPPMSPRRRKDPAAALPATPPRRAMPASRPSLRR